MQLSIEVRIQAGKARSWYADNLEDTGIRHLATDNSFVLDQNGIQIGGSLKGSSLEFQATGLRPWAGVEFVV